MMKTVSPNHEDLFYFEAAQQQSVLEIEINWADGKELPGIVIKCRPSQPPQGTGVQIRGRTHSAR